MAERTARRLLIIGWDAADWKLIDPLMKQGAMPNLARLLKAGSRADLSTLEPRLSPILWTSITTGKTPDKHGILNFLEPDPAEGGSVRVSSSTSRKTKALWNILTQAGLRVNVVSWYASHPAEPISGACVSNLFLEGMPVYPADAWPMLPGAVHPVELSGDVASKRVHAGTIARHQLQSMIPGLATVDRADPRPKHLAKALAQCRSVHEVAKLLLERDTAWDCTMVFHEAVDVIGHHFMQYHPPRMKHVSQRDFNQYSKVMSEAYKLHDRMLGEMLERAGPDTTVMLLSDHGFHSDHQRPGPRAHRPEEHEIMDAAWHRQFGVLALSGPGVRAGAQVVGPTLLDIAPTALRLLGLPTGEDMYGRVLAEALERPGEAATIPSWDEREGEAGLHPADLRQDPFEARDAMAQLVELGYLAGLPQDQQAKIDLVSRESRYNLAVALMTTQRSAQAAEILEELHRAHPDHPRYSMSFAKCCLHRGRYEEARAVLTAHLEHHPDDSVARLSMAAAYYEEHRHAEAAKLLEALEGEVPAGSERRPELDQMLGMCYVLLRRPADAQRVFSRAVTADRRNAVAHHGMALASLLRERFEEAAGHCLDALELSRAYPDAHYTLGTALAWMKDYPNAVKSFKLAIAQQPGMIDAHRFLAAVYERTGEATLAREHEDRASELFKTLDVPGAHPGSESNGGSTAEGYKGPPMGVDEWREGSKAKSPRR